MLFRSHPASSAVFWGICAIAKAAWPPRNSRRKPYTCMVKVPDATHDDLCQKQPPVPNLPMQILQPDLNSVPLGRSGKSATSGKAGGLR